jgi:N-methylhydantoinase B/oxoprolinase/acetone carboxylase alpha subunit
MNQNFFYFFQGIRLINSLIDEYGLDVVQAYMKHIQVNKLPVVIQR